MSKKYLFIIALLTTVAILAAVGLLIGSNNPQEQVSQADMGEIPEVVPPEGFEPRTLAGTSWSWMKTDLLSGEVIDAPEGDKFVIAFGEDGTVTSTTDCNMIRSAYAEDGEVLGFTPFASTKMLCEGSQESVYSQHLSLSTSFMIEGETLKINLNRDFGTMTFVAR